MKKNVLSLAIVLGLSLISFSSYAQRPKLFGGTHLPKELNLTEAQQQKVQQLNKEYRSKVLEIRSDSLIARENRQNKMQELRKQHDADIKGILTTEQSSKWAKMNDRRQGNRSDRNINSLGLTADQKKEIEVLSKDIKAKREALNAQSGLSRADKEAKRAELRKEHQAAMDKILTAEQHTKLKEKNAVDRRKESRKDFRGQKQPWSQQRNMAQRPNRNPFDGLNLTEDQKQKIKSVNDEFKVKNKALAEERRAAITEVLTPEQQAKFNERQEKIKNRSQKSDSGMKFKRNLNKSKDRV